MEPLVERWNELKSRGEIDISLNIRNYLGIDDQLSTAEMEIDGAGSSHTELEPEPLHAKMESFTSYFMEYDPLLDDVVLPEEQSEYYLGTYKFDQKILFNKEAGFDGIERTKMRLMLSS